MHCIATQRHETAVVGFLLATSFCFRLHDDNADTHAEGEGEHYCFFASRLLDQSTLK